MSTIPTVESILLEIHQSLGCESYPTKTKQKFAAGDMELSNYRKKAEEILDAIFRSLDMDPLAQDDTLHHLENWLEFNKRVEWGTWTFEADERQVLWQMLGYCYVPGIARIAAFWNLEEAMDKGMPGGRFWYLPESPEVTGKPQLYLPVAQVVDWLLDLLGMPLEEFVSGRSQSASNANDEESDGLTRSLYNWRKETTPNRESFLKYFPDSMNITFRGTFTPDSAETPARQFAAALEFVKSKKLTVDQLRREIPMTASGRLEAIFNGSARENEKAYFVKCLADRYALPSPKTIRKRLLFARLVQDGYTRLLKKLFPDVDRLCTDRKRNKLLQLIEIYKTVYNATINAWREHSRQGRIYEDIYFEGNLPQFSKKILFWSILPSMKESAHIKLPQYLNHCFKEFQPGNELEDHVWFDNESGREIIARNENRLSEIDEIRLESYKIIYNLTTSPPWPILQRVKKYSALNDAIRSGNLNEPTRQMAIRRLYDLSCTPSQEMETITLELSFLLDSPGTYPEDTQTQVEELLERAKSSDGFPLWKAVILHYESTHLLASNRFDDAIKKLREALEACRERNYGLLRGVVARDIFFLEIAKPKGKLIPNSHEKYYREMCNGGIFEGWDTNPSIEECVTLAHDIFKQTLYKPYAQTGRID